MVDPYLILLVEDNSDDELLTIRALRKVRPACHVIVKRDGEEAEEYLAGLLSLDAGPTPDLILLDLKLPKLDGFEVLDLVRSNPKVGRTPTIMLSSSDEPTDLLRCYEKGASGFVRKPVGFDDYADAVRVLGLYWMGVNLSPARLL